jgi:hypothetical protein
MSLDSCPQCNKKLPPPFKSSGRQVCIGCGWTDIPNKVIPIPKSHWRLDIDIK